MFRWLLFTFTKICLVFKVLTNKFGELVKLRFHCLFVFKLRGILFLPNYKNQTTHILSIESSQDAANLEAIPY